MVADEELRAYWQSRSLQERLEALDDLRIAIYGEAAINAQFREFLACLNFAGAWSHRVKTTIDDEPV